MKIQFESPDVGWGRLGVEAQEGELGLLVICGVEGQAEHFGGDEDGGFDHISGASAMDGVPFAIGSLSLENSLIDMLASEVDGADGGCLAKLNEQRFFRVDINLSGIALDEVLGRTNFSKGLALGEPFDRDDCIWAVNVDAENAALDPLPARGVAEHALSFGGESPLLRAYPDLLAGG